MVYSLNNDASFKKRRKQLWHVTLLRLQRVHAVWILNPGCRWRSALGYALKAILPFPSASDRWLSAFRLIYLQNNRNAEDIS